MRFAAAALAMALGALAIGDKAVAGSPQPFSSFKDCDACPEMVVLPPGKFLMGASSEDRKLADEYTIASELPQHEVTIGYSFAIGKFEVTVAEFAAYVAETGAETGGECQIVAAVEGPADGSPWRKDGCEQFVQRSYDFAQIAMNLRSAARCLPGDWDGRANNLTIRVAVSLDGAAWDRKD